VDSIQELSSELTQLLLSEGASQEGISVIRGRRQRLCLLNKKLVEEEDVLMESEMLLLIEKCYSRIK